MVWASPETKILVACQAILVAVNSITEIKSRFWRNDREIFRANFWTRAAGRGETVAEATFSCWHQRTPAAGRWNFSPLLRTTHTPSSTSSVHLQKIFHPGGKRKEAEELEASAPLHSPPQIAATTRGHPQQQQQLQLQTFKQDNFNNRRSKKAAQGSACPQFKVRKQ